MQQDRQSAVIARAGVVVIGLAAIVYGVYQLQKFSGFVATTFAELPERGVGWDNWLILFGTVLGPAILLGTGILLVRSSDAISRKYFYHAVLGTEVVVYRVAFAVVGLFFITAAFTKLVTLLANLATRYLGELPSDMHMGPSYFWPWIVSALVNLCVGLYLFLGAPALLGWHLKRCKAVDGVDGTSVE